jgi:hypothetical protein
MIKHLQYLIVECYKKDFNPYIDKKYADNLCNEYTFKRWYFDYREQRLYHFYCLNKKKYYHTPMKLLIGDDVYTAPLHI